MLDVKLTTAAGHVDSTRVATYAVDVLPAATILHHRPACVDFFKVHSHTMQVLNVGTAHVPFVAVEVTHVCFANPPDRST
jgi:hypothetical protein